MLNSKSLNCELFIYRLSGCSFGLLNERNLSWENESMHEMPSFGLLEFRPMSDIVERLHRPLLTIISYIHTLSWRSFGLYTRVGDQCSPPLPILIGGRYGRFAGIGQITDIHKQQYTTPTHLSIWQVSFSRPPETSTPARGQTGVCTDVGRRLAWCADIQLC